MSSLTTTKNDLQIRTQRRLLFEGFNVHDTGNSSRRNQSSTMVTSTPDPKLNDKEGERFDLTPTTDSIQSEPCLLQLQNARQLLHTISRTNTQINNEHPIITDHEHPLKSELFSETNPELAYYKSSLESERSRRKQLETLIDVQQQRLTEAESELIQLRANDHKKTLCMKQLEQMIPNVVEEWKQKENEYKIKLNNLQQQIKQHEQNHREKILNEKHLYDEQLNERKLLIERLTRDNDKLKQDHDNVQSKMKQYEDRIQQLTKESEQAKQSWSTLETDLRNEIKTNETRLNNIHADFDKKQHEIEQILREQNKLNNDHQTKIRQLENELDEQRRENNVLKMELELREAKYRAQTESLKIQLMRDAETKLTQRLDEQNRKHMQIENELNELHRRKLADLNEKHEQTLLSERQENESRIQTLLSKIEQMKTEMERIQSTTMAERQDLAKKLQDVFETTLLKGSTKVSFAQSESTVLPISTNQLISMKSQLIDTQIKEKHNDISQPLPSTISDYPTNISTIRTLSSRIDSLVDQTNRVANGFELNPRLATLSQQDNGSEWIENNQNHLLSSRPHSALHSPYFRSTPIDQLNEWHPQTTVQPPSHTNNIQLTTRSQSAELTTTSGLFSTYPSNNYQQAHSSNSYSLESNLNTSHYRAPSILSYITSNMTDHQQNIQETVSKDSIEKQHSDQITTSANESLSKYVKMLLERSPMQDNSTSNKHPLAKTNRSLHDLQLSIDQLNLAERDSNGFVDDLVANNDSHSPDALSARQNKPTVTHAVGAKKRLDYDQHNHKQTNTNELFERLAQPKARVKKDKTKQSHPTTGGHGAWK